MNDKLNPCPFCGEDDITVDYRETVSMFERNDYAHCSHCGASAKLKNWNDRPIECGMNERISDLESKVEYLGKQRLLIVESPSARELRLTDESNQQHIKALNESISRNNILELRNNKLVEEIVSLQSRNDELEKLVKYWIELHDITYNLMDDTDSAKSLYLENKEKISNLITP